jgi:hypothetical protein
MDEPYCDDVLVIEVGGPKWRRWMIYHNFFKCYWGRASWWKRRRNGELWDNEDEAQIEANFARLNSDHIRIEDYDE